MINVRTRLAVMHRYFGLGSVFMMVRACLALWHRHHRTRLQLGQLDDRQLADIGLVPRDQKLECEKWFWRR